MYGDPNYFANQNNPWYPNTTQNQQQWVPQVKTNKILVTSLEEAISKSGERHSEMYYYDQNKPVIYVVRTDMNGVKSWGELRYTIPNQEDTTPATKADVSTLAARLDALAAKLEILEPAKTVKRKKNETTETEVTENVESIG